MLKWPQWGTLELGSKVVVFGDGGSGQINNDQPLSEVETWPVLMEKWGWGLDCFGGGDFGYSGTGAIGWGRGHFGGGEFGFEARGLHYRSPALASGTYQYAVKLRDRMGRLDDGEGQIRTVTVDPLPRGAGVSIASYDEENDRLVLSIDLSD